jgi:[ribosomal protein S5]-alanine N-acetyltransferase
MGKYKEVNKMELDNFYKVLDSLAPGGTLDYLDKAIVLNRNLYLTKISMDGLIEMHEYSKDSRLYKYFEFEPFKDIDETRRYLQKLVDRVGKEVYDRKFMYWFIRTIEDNKIIGSIGLVDIDVYRGAAQWGYAISPHYWGQGYILEAQLLVIKYFFEELKMNRLWGITPVDNYPTISSIFSAGFQKEGILRDYYKYHNDQRKDGLIYSLLAKDYFNTGRNDKQKQGNDIITSDQLKKIFVSILELSDTDVNENTNMHDIPEWDSLNHIKLIIQIEEETGFKFKPLEIAQATCFKTILEIVNGLISDENKEK